MPVITVSISLILDRILGEPKRYHPLVGFGILASKLENKLLTENIDSPDKQRLLGIIACLMLITPPVFFLLFILYKLANYYYLAWIINIMILYLVIGAYSLEEHALKVKNSLDKKNMDSARKNVSCLVSRNTEQLDEEGICKATIESVLENGSDAVFAPIFWFMIAGAPGALCYRLINTLDAMWGYRNQRYLHFGWMAARLDDVINWLPARLTALSYALMGNFQHAIDAWLKQGKLWESPNAGPVMASGAGALSLILGGPAVYHGNQKDRPVLGQGLPPANSDINRAIHLIRRSVFLWLFIILLGSYSL